MTIPFRALAVGLAVLAFSVVLFGRAQAGGGHFYPAVADPVVQEECGGCHLAYSPAMLPARSWQKLMGGLDQHFGDNAALDAALAERIGRYLADNAADAAGQPYGRQLMRGMAAAAAPLRITELPAWQRAHRSVPAWEWAHRDVRSRANCVACHADATRGFYDQ